MSSLVGASEDSFHDILDRLLKLPPPLLPPIKVSDPTITDQICSLYVHPSLEAALHILNSDLPSAHFLCRHMQAAPEHEGMLIHGILHRIEGDYDNARAWYQDVVESSVFKHVWKQPSEAFTFLSQIEALRKDAGKGEELKPALTQQSVEEIKRVIQFCLEKFGESKVQDATRAWKQAEGKVKDLGQEMTIGNEGFRKF